uniref:Secreted protein n=1 Tax=Steinernema glaseri TaxID=37863 RepID=A0A1I8AP03_9BILA
METKRKRTILLILVQRTKPLLRYNASRDPRTGYCRRSLRSSSFPTQKIGHSRVLPTVTSARFPSLVAPLHK